MIPRRLGFARKIRRAAGAAPTPRPATGLPRRPPEGMMWPYRPRRGRRTTGMATFVPDSDPKLCSLLAPCQLADDVRPPMTDLADWLEARGDPRAPLVRLGARFWEIVHLKGGQDEEM